MPFKVGDLAQWRYPRCTVQVLAIRDDGLSIDIEALPGVNGMPIDIEPGFQCTVGPDSLDPEPLDPLDKSIWRES